MKNVMATMAIAASDCPIGAECKAKDRGTTNRLPTYRESDSVPLAASAMRSTDHAQHAISIASAIQRGTERANQAMPMANGTNRSTKRRGPKDRPPQK